MKRRLSTILFGVVFIAGLSLLLYPTVSDYWNSFHQSRAIASYVDAVDNTDEQKLDEMRKAAQAYNEKLLSKQDRYEMSIRIKQSMKVFLMYLAQESWAMLRFRPSMSHCRFTTAQTIQYFR